MRRYGCNPFIKEENLSEEQRRRCLDVLKELPTEIGTFFVKSFQSYIFNKVLQWRVQKYKNTIIPGDLVQHENGVIMTSTPETDSTENVVLPLFGLLWKG